MISMELKCDLEETKKFLQRTELFSLAESLGGVESLIEHPLLVIDDLGKERLTSRMASDLFAIVDERSVNRKTTIISTNFNGTTLLERFENKDKETGVAFIRRLKDYYTIVGCS